MKGFFRQRVLSRARRASNGSTAVRSFMNENAAQTTADSLILAVSAECDASAYRLRLRDAIAMSKRLATSGRGRASSLAIASGDMHRVHEYGCPEAIARSGQSHPWRPRQYNGLGDT